MFRNSLKMCQRAPIGPQSLEIKRRLSYSILCNGIPLLDTNGTEIDVLKCSKSLPWAILCKEQIVQSFISIQ